ncbi:MAG: hypothetical protein JO166_20210 [Deltaproteobacteria bacterium]|nr:hypothetical protein [Deltaproteobacteria bacterium]
MAAERARQRIELLAATERALDEIAAATQRPRKPLRSKARIGLRVGGVLGRYKMAKHFQLTISQALPTPFVDHCERAVWAPAPQTVMDEVHRPGLLAALGSERSMRR